MDRDQAFAFLGLPEDATHDDIETRADARRRQLELRLKAAVTDEQRALLRRALRELEEIRALALLDPRDPAAGVPAGAAMMLKSGTLLADRYAVKTRIGVGERGAVFRALDLTWGRDVALKALLPEALLVPGTIDRLGKVLRRHLGFAHPSLASTYSLGRSDGVTFIASELIEGETLRQYVARTGASGLNLAAIERIARAICSALAYNADRAPHLNLKPENVLIAKDGTVKLTDFGLDEVVPVIARGRSRTMTEQRLFRAPEQARNAQAPRVPEQVDERADQYGAAALIYFMATGEAPSPDSQDLAQRRPDLPGPFVAAVRRGLSAAPEARYPTVNAFAADLLRHRGRRARALIIGAVAAVLTAATGLAAWKLEPDMFDPTWWTAPWQRRAGAEQQQAAALAARTAELRTRLEAAERDLRVRVRDARAQVQTMETSAAKGPGLTVARADRDMLELLSAIAIPQVFNSPEILNAYNRLALATDHLASARHTDAIAILAEAETVMAARLEELRAAERLARVQFGLDAAPGTTPKVDAGSAVRTALESAIAERREFAKALDQRLVLIPAGTFTMGDVSGHGTRAELPLRQVTVSAFKLGRTPVTTAEYRLCVEAGACRWEAAGDRGVFNPAVPVTRVNWEDAQDYAAWLRARTGEDYRLPSEAEWEYAARAGATANYPWGNDIGQGRANCANCGSAWDQVGPAPVATFAPNAFGLYDVVGNVWQWTADCWYRDYSTAPSAADARDAASCEKRVLRGGSWDNDSWMARLSYRGVASAGLRQDINGFRIAKSVD